MNSSNKKIICPQCGSTYTRKLKEGCFWVDGSLPHYGCSNCRYVFSETEVQAVPDELKEIKLRDIPDYGQPITLKDFIRAAETNVFIDDDGFGYYSNE